MDGRRQVANRRGRRITFPHLGKFCGGAVVWPRSARRQECVLQLSCSLRTSHVRLSVPGGSGPARSQAFRTLAPHLNARHLGSEVWLTTAAFRINGAEAILDSTGERRRRHHPNTLAKI